MNRVIITGSEGFIGKALEKKLCESGVAVHGWDIKKPCLSFTDGIDLRIPMPISIKPTADTIFHLAAYSDNYGDPVETFRTNTLTTLNMLEVADRLQARFIFASTYLTQQCAYVHSKRLCEDMVRWYVKGRGLKACIVNCANVYGPGDENQSRIIPLLINKMLKKEDVTVSNTLRDFVYIDNVVNAYVALGNSKPLPHVCGLGSGNLFSLEDIGKCIQQDFQYGEKVKVLMGRDEYDPKAPETDTLGKLNALPQTTICAGIRATVEWWKSKKA